jgi:hypothetical protein
MTDSQKPVEQQPIQQAPQQPGVPYQQPVQVQYVVSQQSLEGLGGWLMFWVVIFSLTGIGYITTFFGSIQHGGTAAATLALIFTPLLAGLYIASVVLIALRKKLGKWFSIGTLGVSALYITIGVIIAVSQSGTSEMAVVAGTILVNIVLHGLFALYFIVSKRVQLTLVR